MKSVFDYEYEFIDYPEGIPMKVFFVGISDYPFHWHKDVELILVLDGELQVLFEEERFPCGRGGMALIDRYLAHAFSGNESMLLILQFDPSLCRQEGGLLSRDFFSLEQRNPTVFRNLRIALAHLGREFLLKRQGHHLAVKGWFYRLLSILVRHCWNEEEGESLIQESDLHRVQKLLEFIDEHFREDLHLENLKEHFHLSPSRISHIFAEKVGMSFRSYLSLLRLDYARQLLHETDYTILRVALECGFGNESALYRLFRHYLGISPGEYRKNKAPLFQRPRPNGYTYFGSDDILKALKDYL